MKAKSIRTTLELPLPVYRKLKQQAAAQRCTLAELILAAISRSLPSILGRRARRGRRAKFPVIKSTGHKIDLTNEQIYNFVGFP